KQRDLASKDMNRNAEFHFDFGSPSAYLSHLVIAEIEQRMSVKFDYLPVLLAGIQKITNNRPATASAEMLKNEREYMKLETQRFIAKYRIKRFRCNPFFPLNTLAIMRGAVAAKRLGCFERYVDEVYRHVWAEPKKMDAGYVIRAALEASGL